MKEHAKYMSRLVKYQKIKGTVILAELTGEDPLDEHLEIMSDLEDKIEEVKPGWKKNSRRAQPRQENTGKPSTPTSELY